MDIEIRPNRLLRILVTLFVILPLSVVTWALRIVAGVVAIIVVSIMQGWDDGVHWIAGLDAFSDRWRL